MARGRCHRPQSIKQFRLILFWASAASKLRKSPKAVAKRNPQPTGRGSTASPSGSRARDRTTRCWTFSRRLRTRTTGLILRASACGNRATARLFRCRAATKTGRCLRGSDYSASASVARPLRRAWFSRWSGAPGCNTLSSAARRSLPRCGCDVPSINAKSLGTAKPIEEHEKKHRASLDDEATSSRVPCCAPEAPLSPFLPDAAPPPPSAATP
jgi:hypothetical protein